MKKTAIAAALCLAAALLPAGAAAADVTGPPVVNAPVFNDPVADSGTPGTPSAQQSAVMDQLIRLIRAARAGGEIRFVMFEFTEGQRSTEVADALIAAHGRGVKVKVILNGSDKNAPVAARLRSALGGSESAASYVVSCPAGRGFWATPTGSKHKALFLPRAKNSGDHIANVLKLVECGYRDTDGVKRQTDVRLALTAFNQHRKAIAQELVRLRGKGCWVDVVYYQNNMDDTIRAELARTASNGLRIQVTPCRFTAGDRSVVPHTKLMMTDGFYDDDITPRVYTGSANFTHLENADDSIVRISGRDVHDQYLSYFYKIRDTCRART